MEIKTSRLILRDLRSSDLANLVEQANNLNVSRTLLLVPYPYTMKDGKWFVSHCITEAKKKPRENYEFGIELRSERGIIGMVSLTNVDEFQKKATIGYWLGEDHWGSGIMSEAVESLVNFGFRKLKLVRIDSEVYVGNTGSKKVLEKAGFTYEGLRKKYSRAKSTGEFRDSEIYGLLRGDWNGK